MKYTYEKPELELICFQATDTITNGGIGDIGDNPDYDGGLDESGW